MRLDWFGFRRLSWPLIGVLSLTSVASAGLFSIADPLLLAPLPYPKSYELISIEAPLELSRRLMPRELERLSVQLEETPLVASRATVRAGFAEELSGGAVDPAVVHYVVGPEFFSTLGIPVLHGRPLDRADLHDASPRSVVIDESLWRTRFARDLSALGATASFGGQQGRIVGIVSTESAFPAGGTIWSVGGRADPSELPNLARLAPGVSIDDLRARFPGLVVTTLEEHVRPKQRLTLWLILGSAAAMVVIGWLQAAMLRLSRLTARLRENAIHAALGASPARVRARTGLESLAVLLVTLAITLTCLRPVTALLARVIAAGFPEWNVQAPTMRPFGFAVLAAVGGAVMSHVAATSFMVNSGALAVSLRPAAVLSPPSFLGRRLSLIVAIQVAATVGLLYGTSLALQTFARLSATPLGYRPENVYALLPSGVEGLPVRTDLFARQQESLVRMRALPGVLSATTAFRRPSQTGAFQGTARSARASAFSPRTVRVNYVGDDYFSTVGIPILEGTAPGRIAGGVVIDSTLARELAAANLGIGDVLQVTSHREAIVGIVGDVAQSASGITPHPQVYFRDAFSRAQTFLVHTDGSRRALAGVTGILANEFGQDGEIVAMPLSDDWRRVTAPARARVLLLMAIALASCALAIAGIAANVAYTMRLKRKELGLRLALGAPAFSAARGLVAGTAGIVAFGCAAGLGASLTIARTMAATWHGVQWFDPVSAAGAVALFSLVALASAAWPLRRAFDAPFMFLLREE
jgi:ABC-type antimicrobial peptide transport system permease subunit